MHCRNERVSLHLQDHYRNQGFDDIKVFCVGNRLYWGKRDEPRRASLPYLHLSGIIRARKHCLSVVSNSQRRAAKHFIEDRIPTLLAQIDHWAQSGSRSGSVERREAIRQMLDQVESRLAQVRPVYTHSSIRSILIGCFVSRA